MTAQASKRRALARAKGLNGLECIDSNPDRPKVLDVAFLKEVPAGITPANIQITGSGAAVVVKGVNSHLTLPRCAEVHVDRPGDFSEYRLEVVDLPGFDPLLSTMAFFFRPECSPDVDCAIEEAAAVTSYPEPALTYMAKDYASFREMVLDRMSTLMGGPTERHIPDQMVTVKEMLAYAGDECSYRQDAVATEAYLNTARHRISVRRHARLVAYPMHDGVNARAHVCVEVDEPITLEEGRFRFATLAPDAPGPSLSHHALVDLNPDACEIFEPLLKSDVLLDPMRNEIPFWTFGDDEYELPVGSTSAALANNYVTDVPWLEPGMLLVLEAVGDDADPAHRQVVRLTKVTPLIDPLFDTESGPHRVYLVSWASGDALQFALQISHGKAVARGNVLLVDHGRSNTFAFAQPEPLPKDLALPGTPITQCTPYPDPAVIAQGQVRLLESIPARALAFLTDTRRDLKSGRVSFQDRKQDIIAIVGSSNVDDEAPGANPVDILDELIANFHGITQTKTRRLRVLTARVRAGQLGGRELIEEIERMWGGQRYSGGLEPDSPLFRGPASAETVQNPQVAMPALRLESDEGAWVPRRDLIASDPHDRHFVAEVDEFGALRIRFGVHGMGQAPTSDAVLRAISRTGTPIAGNVGAETINRIVGATEAIPHIVRVRNPLPAVGGMAPETVQQARDLAPDEYSRIPQRAIVETDYAMIAGRLKGVQRAAANARWTGSWYEMHIAIDGLTGSDPALLASVHDHVYPLRRIGHEVVTMPAQMVPVDLAMRVCVSPGHSIATVRTEVTSVIRGYFDPDRLTFGTPIRASVLVAAVARVPGVCDATVTKLQRLNDPPAGELARGFLSVGPNAVAQLDFDEHRVDRGRFTLEIGTAQ